MARGKSNKLTKAERESAKANIDWPQASRAKERLILPAHNDYVPTTECSHQNICPHRMEKVSGLMTDLFLTSLRNVTASLYRDLVQNLQDSVFKVKLFEYLAQGLSPSQIQCMLEQPSLKSSIALDIREAYDEHLPQEFLAALIEDCCTTLSAVGADHGWRVGHSGPPCACSFAACLPCLPYLPRRVAIKRIVTSKTKTRQERGRSEAGARQERDRQEQEAERYKFSFLRSSRYSFFSLQQLLPPSPSFNSFISSFPSPAFFSKYGILFFNHTLSPPAGGSEIPCSSPATMSPMMKMRMSLSFST